MLHGESSIANDALAIVQKIESLCGLCKHRQQMARRHRRAEFGPINVEQVGKVPVG